MVLKLYTTDLSPPVRAVMMGCDVFNVPVEMLEVNYMERERITPGFRKKNPINSAAVLEDDDVILHDSHAILMYLADKYGKDDSWYPKDTKQRTLVNQKLFFDSSIIFPTVRDITFSIVQENKKTIEPKLIDKIHEAYEFLNRFLVQTTYIAAEQITIADLSVISNITSLAHILPIGADYLATLEWVIEMEKKPYCEKFNYPGATSFGQLVKKTLES